MVSRRKRKNANVSAPTYVITGRQKQRQREHHTEHRGNIKSHTEGVQNKVPKIILRPKRKYRTAVGRR